MDGGGGGGGGGAAFTNPSSGKIDQQRKILEELERQKKLLKSGNGAGLVSTVPPPLTGPPAAGAVPQTVIAGEGRITTGQRNALESANKSSYGFFIPQDSDFGNIILPVIPRIPNKNPPRV